MTRKGWFMLLGAACLTLGEGALAQRGWRVYTAADGLPEPACMTVTVSPQGKVLVRHPNTASVSRLDGYNISVIPAAPECQGRIYESPGGQLWTVAREGLKEFKGGAWVLRPVAEVAAAFPGLKRFLDPIPLFPVRQGLVLLLLPDRFLEVDFEEPTRARTRVLRTAAQIHLGNFCGMSPARDGGLWIICAHGLAKAPGPARNLKPESEWQQYAAPELFEFEPMAEPHEDEDGIVTAVADSSQGREKVLAQFDGQQWTSRRAGGERIRHGWRGPDKRDWTASIDALFQWADESAPMIENEEISARQYFDLAVEPGGAFWLATSDGLFRYAPNLWRTPGPAQKIDSLIHCVTGDREGRLWFMSASGLHALQNGQLQDYAFPAESARRLQLVRALLPLKDGSLALDAGEQLFRFEPRSGRFRAIPGGGEGKRPKPLGLLKDGNLCAQIVPTDLNEPLEAVRLEVWDGSAFKPFPEPPPEPTVGSNLSTLFTAQNGDVWLSGERGSALYHDKKWRAFTSTDKTTPESASCFTELADGKIWCATLDKIWEFDGKNWSVVRPGFDRINGLARTREGSVWVASNSGLHRFFQGAWVENGMEEGLPSGSVRGVCEDSRGHLWAGTARGLSLYFPEADPDPPQSYVRSVPEQGKDIPEGATLTLNFSGVDKWNCTPRHRLLYSYRLDDREWSAFQELNTLVFTDLASGKHYFQVRAMDRNCNIDPRPPTLELAVIAPWYRESRLVVISSLGAVVAIFFAGLAFNRHRQLLRSYAEVERKIAERTRELELAGRELLHSQKMNALGTLAAGIAHDFNNILSIIKGSAQIIEDNLENPGKVRTRVDRIKTVVEQGAGIVKAMLGFSRESDDQPALCDVNAAVEDTIKLLGDRFLREIQVSFEPAPDLPPIACSKDFIQQILLNFIFNAAESVAKRKQILLETRLCNAVPPGVVLMPAQASLYISISVRDFGCGIPAENMARIFEPFFTTKSLSARRGTGLGLSMVYELARKLDAGLVVESVLDEGSTFTLVLPVREPPEELGTAGPERHARPDLRFK